ncbi:MAG TPA: hypothetical protein VNT33_12030 [Telluria sp.]|nr:hypothetical protein [Telluria sp.]
MQNTVHFILQGKGGIGKTLVSTILAQWLAQKEGQALRCFDTDQENPTFSRYKALNVKHVPVLNDHRTIDPKRFDGLMVDIIEGEGNVVVDNGANSFTPLMAYLLENDALSMLEEDGRKVYIHTIVGGGDTLFDTATGFASTAKSTRSSLILWENEHFGKLASPAGKTFTESQTYLEHADRVRGKIVLAARNPDTFGADLKKMNTARLIAEEARASERFNLMEKQRIKVMFRDLFEQLDKVNW